MAIARCQQCGQPEEMKRRYPHVHSPLSDSQVLCGSRHCKRPALVWLSDDEEWRYRVTALRIFSVVCHGGVEVD